MASITQAPYGASELIRMPLHEALLGHSGAIREVNELIRRLAPSRLTVLITGESGTGKDITARLLHRHSPRASKPFIKVNCPAIPESILESELFGYERGAFTGARNSKPGRFELANHGTIFLDEIAETSYTVQSKLLQVLDGEPFMRIGGVTPVHTDVRMVAATNLSLEEAVRQKRMRQDIYYRLTDVTIRMPALRERPEDIPLLAEHFNYNFHKKLGREYKPIPDDLITQLQQLRFPGNVRELAARVKKYVTTRSVSALLEDEAEEASGASRAAVAIIRSSDGVAEEDKAKGAHVERNARRFPSLKEATRRAVADTERRLILEALQETLWNRRKAAKLLDISYSSLLRRIDAYDIGRSDFE